MKNKTKTYLLIAAVLGIWGTIAFKIIDGINPDAPEIAQSDFDENFKPKTISSAEPFTIEELDRDPFLGTLTKNKNLTRTSIKPNASVKNNFPSIVFNGIVKNQNAKDQVFIISINNKQHLIKRGQTIDSVTLMKGDINEIVIRYHTESQTIIRE